MVKGLTVIPVAGGKGGVGKSFLTANLAVALAEMGHRVIVADLDFGGSNLFAFLGMTNKYPGVGDFLRARSAALEALLVPTPVSNLKYLPGDGKAPFMANVPYAQKMRLIGHLRQLPADFLLLDLSAGSAFNTLDFFRASTQGLVVTVPEYPAILNLMTFLKHAVIRTIEKAFAGNPEIRSLFAAEQKRPMAEQRFDVKTLKAKISAIDPSAATRISTFCEKFRPRIVFNKGDHPDDMNITRQIDTGLEEILSIQGDYFGFVFRDPGLRRTVNERQIFLHDYPQSPTAECIRQIAARIAGYWEIPIEGSARRIYERANQLFTASS